MPTLARSGRAVRRGRNFCAGADLKAMGGADGNRVEPDGDGPMGPTRMVLSKPVIAAISGSAVAGGLELALWCDLRVAEEDAVLGVFCRRWGVPLIDGGTVRLPQVVGLGRALDLILTGRAVPAAEALELGLVNRVVPPAGPARPRSSWPARYPRSRKHACAMTGYPHWKVPDLKRDPRWLMSSAAEWPRSRIPAARTAWPDSGPAWAAAARCPDIDRYQPPC